MYQDIHYAVGETKAWFVLYSVTKCHWQFGAVSAAVTAGGTMPTHPLQQCEANQGAQTS